MRFSRHVMFLPKNWSINGPVPVLQGNDGRYQSRARVLALLWPGAASCELIQVLDLARVWECC